MLSNTQGPYGACLKALGGTTAFYDACSRGVCNYLTGASNTTTPANALCAAASQLETACTSLGQPFVSMFDRCGVCQGNGSSCPVTETPTLCSAFGRIQYQTFDGLAVSFAGSCDYVLALGSATDATSGFTYTFQVQMRHSQCQSAGCNSTCISALGVSWSISNGVTGSAVMTPTGSVNSTDPSVVSLQPLSQTSVLTLFLGSVVVRWQYGQEIVTVGAVPSLWLNHTAGVCGPFSGMAAQDRVQPSGKVATTDQLFGIAWQVPAGSRLLPNGATCNDPFQTPVAPCNAAQKLAVDTACAALADPSGPFAACLTVVDVTPYVASCQSSSCNCRSTRFTTIESPAWRSRWRASSTGR